MIVGYRAPTFSCETPADGELIADRQCDSPSMLLEGAVEVELVAPRAFGGIIRLVAAYLQLAASHTGDFDQWWCSVASSCSSWCRWSHRGSRSGCRRCGDCWGGLLDTAALQVWLLRAPVGRHERLLRRIAVLGSCKTLEGVSLAAFRPARSRRADDRARILDAVLAAASDEEAQKSLHLTWTKAQDLYQTASDGRDVYIPDTDREIAFLPYSYGRLLCFALLCIALRYLFHPYKTYVRLHRIPLTETNYSRVHNLSKQMCEPAPHQEARIIQSCCRPQGAHRFRQSFSNVLVLCSERDRSVSYSMVLDLVQERYLPFVQPGQPKI